MFGFINVYKPKGITSHDVVAKLRRATKIKQIGHTGTLDPFAEGVLPVCIGKATRLIEYLKDDKEYLATVQFGAATNTFDTEGEFTSKSTQKINRGDLEKELENFRGEILQTPPIYSALKVNGKKLYEYAREGKSVEIEPRKVTIYKLELKSFDEATQMAELLISCSKGTYIRSIANDLGQNLGCGGYLTKLIRTKAGAFVVENSVKDFENNVGQNLINPLEVIDLPKIEITDSEHDKVLNGQAFIHNTSENGTIILIYNSSIDAIALCENNSIKVKKVFKWKRLY